MLGQAVQEQIQYTQKQDFDKTEFYKQLIHQQLAHPSIGYATVPTSKPVYKQQRRPVSYIPVNYPRHKLVQPVSPSKSFVQSYKPVTPAYYPEFRPVIKSASPEPVTFVTPTPEHKNEEIAITPKPVYVHNEDTLTHVLKMLPQYNPAPQQFPSDDNDLPQAIKPNSLGHLLKALQYSKALPETFTPNNIGTSIKTLLNILNALQSQTNKMQVIVPASLPTISSNKADEIPEPVELPVVPETVEIPHHEREEIPHHEPVDIPTHQQLAPAPGVPIHEAVTQMFPQPTLEGGTPGKPGVDYPALSVIPPTAFDCKTQRYKGFFGDPETNCQVSYKILNLVSLFLTSG